MYTKSYFFDNGFVGIISMRNKNVMSFLKGPEWEDVCLIPIFSAQILTNALVN